MILTAEKIQQIIKEKIPENLVLPEHTEDAHFYRHIPTNILLGSVTAKCNILDAPHLKKWAARIAAEHIIERAKRIEDLPGLKDSAILAHQDQFEEAGDIGTRGHAVVETYLLEWMATGKRPDDIRGFILEEDSRLYAIARSAEMFFKDYDVMPIASELFVASLKHQFGGTLDSLMMVTRITKKGDGTCAKSHDYWNESTRNPNKLICNDCVQKAIREFALVDFKTSNSISGKLEYFMQVSAYAQAFYEMTGLRPKRLLILRLDKNKAQYEVNEVLSPRLAFKHFAHCSKVYDWMNDSKPKERCLQERERISLDSLKLETV